MAESERVALLRAAYDAFNRGEVEPFLELLDEDVQWLPPSTSLEPRRLRGRDSVRRYLAPDIFEQHTAEPLEIEEVGDRILVTVRVTARGRESGVELDQTGFHPGLWPAIA